MIVPGVTTTFLLEFFLSFFISWLLVRFPLAALLDRSGERSLHEGAIPRAGGIAIVISLLVAGSIQHTLLLQVFSLPLLLACGMMMLLSVWDDMKPLHPAARFLLHVLIASEVVFGDQLYFVGGDWLPVVIWQVLTVIGITWTINLYNFMDGMDGFAAGMAMLGFGTLALMGFWRGDLGYAHINVGVVVATAGFWCWNFPPARIFMGDLGSTLLGLLVAISALVGVKRELFPIWVPCVVFSAFWVDASYTLIRRMVAGERFWLPHRSHLYQRLVLAGFSHRQVVLAEYLLMMLGSVFSVLPLLCELGYNATYIPVVYGVVCVLLLVCIEKHLTKRMGAG